MVKGWVEKSIGELFEISGGLSASRAQLSDNGYPYLHYGDIHGSLRTFIDVCSDDTIPFLDVPLNKVSRASLLQDGDVVFVDASEDEEGASRHIVVRNTDGLPFISGLHTIVAKAKTDELNNLFKEFCFQTLAIKAQFRFYAAGTKVVGVSKSSIKDIIISFPFDKSEQRAIAAALSDADAYIAALEKLIAKKRAVKQGAMRELLTGMRRLPGFVGEWVEKPLNRIMRIRKERLNPYAVENTRCIELEHIEPSAGRIIGWTDSKNQRSLKAVFSTGDVLFGKLRPYLKKYLMPDFSGLCSTEFWVFTAYDDSVVNPFIYHLVQTFRFLEVANSTTGTKMPRADWSLMKEVEFYIPIEGNEQTAIAEILSDMDAEIDALTAKLNKVKHIKQGMMRELLTGRIRLVEAKPTKVAVEVYPEAKTEPIRQAAKVPSKGHNQQFDDAVMIAGIVNILYSDKFPLGRKKVQKCLYLLRRHQEESTVAFKKKAAGPYADEVRYKGGEPIARGANYIDTTTSKQGTTFARGKNISQALGYILSWGKQGDIKWVAEKLKFKNANELELLTTVDMAICNLTEAGTPVTVATIKHLIANNAEWKTKLEKQTFSDANITRAIKELQTLLQGGN